MSGTVGYQCTLTIQAGEDDPITVGKARDVMPKSKANEIDVSTRDSGGWKDFIQGLKEWDASVDQLWVPTDAAVGALLDAFNNGTTLAVRFIDPNGFGFEGECIVTAFDQSEPLDGALSASVTLKGRGPLETVAPPVIFSASPDFGAAAGGAAVTILGAGFVDGDTTVDFGGDAGTSVVVLSSTRLTCVAPAHAAGAVDVTVTVDAVDAVLEDGFTYV